MLGVVCLGDATTRDGEMITAISTFFINSIQVALIDDLVFCPKHGVNPIQESDPITTEKGYNAAIDRYQCACGYRAISFQPENSIES